MALSQKHAGKYAVPWFCSAEWKLVLDKIYGSSHTRKTRVEALEIINVWKSRTPLLPRGVEGTYIILEALLINRSLYNDYNLQLLLSTSIMRFLNICAAYDKNQGTFYQTACKIKLPEWLINLRHDIAHGQTLPSLYTLDNAMYFCLEWLNREYWMPAIADMRDFIDNTQFQSDKYAALRETLQPIVANYCYCVLATHPYWDIQYVKDIADEETRISFLDELKTFGFSTSNITENISFVTIQKILWTHILYVLNGCDDVVNKEHIIPELLIKENIFLGDFDDRNKIFPNSETLPPQFITLWSKLLIVMQRASMIEPLIEKLLQLLSIDELKHEIKITAALWLKEIGKGLLKCIFMNDLTEELTQKRLNKSEIKRKVNETLKIKYKKQNVINFNYNLQIPELTSNIEKFKVLFLEKPNEYTKIFISVFLDLNEVFKCREHKTQILNLVDIYTGCNITTEITENPEEIHDVEEFMEDEPIPEEKEITPKSINGRNWRKISEFDFERCPIGILPWQDTAMNPLLH